MTIKCLCVHGCMCMQKQTALLPRRAQRVHRAWCTYDIYQGTINRSTANQPLLQNWPRMGSRLVAPSLRTPLLRRLFGPCWSCCLSISTIEKPILRRSLALNITRHITWRCVPTKLIMPSTPDIWCYSVPRQSQLAGLGNGPLTNGRETLVKSSSIIRFLSSPGSRGRRPNVKLVKAL